MRVNMMNVSIDGFWTTKAGDFDPQKNLKTNPQDNRFFYRLNHDSQKREKVIVEILVDSVQIALVHDWLSRDGKETFFFDIPSSHRKPGVHALIFRVYLPGSEAADAGKGQMIYESPTYTLEYTG
jgi:hypothetical protein